MKGFNSQAASSDHENDFLAKLASLVGSDAFPTTIPEEIKGDHLLLIWLEWELLHQAIIGRRNS